MVGETIGLPLETSDAVLRVDSPLEARFTLVHDGRPAAPVAGRTATWPLLEPGNYRIEAELSILGEWVPWVYTNPIRVTRALPASTIPLG